MATRCTSRTDCGTAAVTWATTATTCKRKMNCSFPGHMTRRFIASVLVFFLASSVVLLAVRRE
uniref:Uncharacterized protein n=1 Tax=Arundo donax TaxID=35708 RepID=A0A0A9D0R0_ARUDO